MDCISCQKCKLHGKIQLLGIGAALKILLLPEQLIAASLERSVCAPLSRSNTRFTPCAHLRLSAVLSIICRCVPFLFSLLCHLFLNMYIYNVLFLCLNFMFFKYGQELVALFNTLSKFSRAIQAIPRLSQEYLEFQRTYKSDILNEQVCFFSSLWL